LFFAVILSAAKDPRIVGDTKAKGMIEYAYVYILASSFKHLYIGMTTDLQGRVWKHKNQHYPNSFTAKYKIDQLVYYERFALVINAIAAKKS